MCDDAIDALQEKDSDKQAEQMDSYEEIVYNISDEDNDILQVLVEPKPTNLLTPSLETNYKIKQEGK